VAIVNGTLGAWSPVIADRADPLLPGIT